jgi:hypothetical protein
LNSLEVALVGLTTGNEPRQTAYCANCRTTGTHKLIKVTEDLTLIWCERCGVPHVGGAEAAAWPTPQPETPAATVPPSRRRWRWWQVKGFAAEEPRNGQSR